MKKHPSPLEAIRRHCLWCCLEQPTEVRHCGATECASYSLRFGKKAAGLNTLKAIKAHCIECGGREEAPKNCQVTDCDLFSFRMGKNPNRARIGNPNAFKPPFPGPKTSTELTIDGQALTETAHYSHEDPQSAEPQFSGRKS